ncbi:uncharacterized protein LOC112045772 isoform X2 [Bicyclus anynana]|uniref:Uncharacterized protein LOC112045772 isoform X2 n=1 Tax=Bicyclus anynana TaxID=110368 RepID=A0ABM3LH48_BICAN|nr:uncharacterized protein LOC112045772 isoform X2 [Bicyclus anynana]
MLRFGIFLAAAVALSTAAPQGISDNVIELDLSPEEAAKYLSNPPFTEPRLSALVKTLPLVKYDDPRFRSAEAGPTLGHYWRNGHEIENPDAYVEEVRYWSDSEGFHQEDNIPKVVLKPVEEAEDVRQARLAHEKAWAEAAAAARQNPDPQGDYYKQYDYQPAASELSGSVVAAPGEAREGKAYNGQFPSYPPSPKPEKYEEPEPTGPPRGFFYKFDYPVSIIVPKNPEEKNPSFNVRNIPY